MIHPSNVPVPRRKRIGPALPVLLCALALGASPAWGKDACKLKLRDLTRIVPTANYDPFGGQEAPEYHRFEVQHLNGPACAFAIGVDYGSNGNRNMADDGNLLTYGLFADASLSQPLTDAFGQQGGLLSGTLTGVKGDTRAEFQFFSIIPAGQLVPAGNYTDEVTFTLYALDDGVVGEILDSRGVRVTTRVRQVVQASVVLGGAKRPLAGAAGVLDLGEVSDGASTSFELEVAGNGEYDLALESENGGRLVKTGGDSDVPYALAINGQTVRLDRAVTLRYDGDGVQRHGFLVSVGEASEALAGTYSDNLILTVRAR